MKRTSQTDKTALFETMPVPKAVLTLAVPTVASILVTLLYSLADTWFVGLLNDPIQNAAVTLIAPVLLAFNAVNNLFGTGCSSMMSRALGRKDTETAQRCASFGFWCSLLCGLLCGPVYGLGCGILAPLLSHLFTGMPPTAMLPSMLCELAAYGMLSGILIRVIRTKWNLLNLYTALIGAMICGRIINGVLNALIFNAGKYSMEMWLTASFLQAIQGIVIQLALIPLLVLARQKARLANRAGAARV